MFRAGLGLMLERANSVDLWGAMVAVNNPDLEAMYERFQTLPADHKAKLLKRILGEGLNLNIGANHVAPITIQINTYDKEMLSQLIDAVAEALVNKQGQP
ncbi:MAG: hypothetical protein HC818_00085 [Synechococcaceae cyanobacterium RM1_1_27]|nr:hypothetical protein [Synechococcaceae cyanobacterium RM1_1_27]